jgi:hypothetical protein
VNKKCEGEVFTVFIVIYMHNVKCPSPCIEEREVVSLVMTLFNFVNDSTVICGKEYVAGSNTGPSQHFIRSSQVFMDTVKASVQCLGGEGKVQEEL